MPPEPVSGLPWGTVLTILTTVGGYLLAFLLIPRILMQRREAGATLAWILIIVFVPYIGAALFFLIGQTRVRRRARKRMRARSLFERRAEKLPHRAGACDVGPEAERLPELERTIARVASCVTGSNPLPGNRVEVFIDANAAYDRMEAAIRGARHHVHMMSYIFREDAAGRRFRDLLAQKAREGVEVRLMVDAMGSHQLDRAFVLPIEEAGGKFASFMPVFPYRPSWRPNLRNHRKILVADGGIGFTGGLNIGDEYQGRKKRYAPWRDTHVCLQGPAVWQLQESFAEDWFFATDEDLSDPAHFPALSPVGDELVQVVSSGPDLEFEAIHAVFFAAITEARKRIYITTPYFIPDPAMLLALKSASWTGVDVRILVPGRSDMKLVQVASRSFFRELLRAGVKIYEWETGMLHAKTMVVDGGWATVGSANMDMRSFRLNFETNLLVSSASFARQMEGIFFEDIAQAIPVTLSALDREPRSARFAEAVGRVLAPVL